MSVYEMTVNNVAVMRRRDDDWLNATQILKVAGVEKGKRTKVLEKEILIGVHEKVQGGYGKYQGTWYEMTLLSFRSWVADGYLIETGLRLNEEGNFVGSMGWKSR